MNDDTEFAVQIEVGKLSHRAGAAREKLLSAADWSTWEILVQRDVYCPVHS